MVAKSDKQKAANRYSMAGWIFETRISIGNLLTIITVVLGSAWWGGMIDNRVTNLEKAVSNAAPYRDKVVALGEAVKNNTKVLERISIKLDRLIERGGMRK